MIDGQVALAKAGKHNGVRRIIPSDFALDLFKAALGDVAVVLAFTGLRWVEAVAVPIGNVSLDGQCMKIDRTASESGGRRDVREYRRPRVVHLRAGRNGGWRHPDRPGVLLYPFDAAVYLPCVHFGGFPIRYK